MLQGEEATPPLVLHARAEHLHHTPWVKTVELASSG